MIFRIEHEIGNAFRRKYLQIDYRFWRRSWQSQATELRQTGNTRRVLGMLFPPGIYLSSLIELNRHEQFP